MPSLAELPRSSKTRSHCHFPLRPTASAGFPTAACGARRHLASRIDPLQHSRRRVTVGLSTRCRRFQPPTAPSRGFTPLRRIPSVTAVTGIARRSRDALLPATRIGLPRSSALPPEGFPSGRPPERQRSWGSPIGSSLDRPFDLSRAGVRPLSRPTTRSRLSPRTHRTGFPLQGAPPFRDATLLALLLPGVFSRTRNLAIPHPRSSPVLTPAHHASEFHSRKDRFLSAS